MSSLLSNIKAFWPLGDAFDAPFFLDSTRRNHLRPYLRFNRCDIQLRLGRNSASGASSGQQAFASLKGWGRWDRVLNGGEKAALAGGEYWPFSTTTSLQDAKVYHLLDEAGGSTSYADATGRGNTLDSVVGTTIQVTGPNGGGDKGTEISSGVSLTRTNPSRDIKSRQVTSTIAGWVNLTSKPTTPPGFAQQALWCQIDNDAYGTGIGNSGLNVYYDPTADRFCADFNAGNNKRLNAGALVMDSALGSPSIGTWYFLIASFDASTGIASLSVNNGTPDTLGPILQPLPDTGHIATASEFQLNPVASFAGQDSGWDADLPVDGNCCLEHVANADLGIGNAVKAVWGWFKTTDPTAPQTLAGFNGGSGATTDWIIQQNANTLSFTMGGDLVTCSVTMNDTNWHFVLCWFDGTDSHIDLDHGAATDSATPTSLHTVATVFRLGSDVGNGGSDNQFRGLLEAWGIADGTPDSTDKDTLWNSGAGWSLAITPFDYYRSITIDHTQVGATAYPEGLEDFNLLVTGTLTPSRVQHASGYDIVFSTDSHGNDLVGWTMMSFNSGTGAFQARVKIYLSTEVDTVLYCVFGNASIVTFQGDTA